MNDREYLTIPEAARILRASEAAVYLRIRQGVLAGEKHGGKRWIIPSSAVLPRVPGDRAAAARGARGEAEGWQDRR